MALPAELFEWQGESLRPRNDRGEHEQEVLRRQEWLRSQGIHDLELTVPVQLTVHEQADDGAFHASFSVGAYGSLLRRATSHEPWEPRIHYPHVHRWSDAQWDWCLGTDHPLSQVQLAELRGRLGS